MLRQLPDQHVPSLSGPGQPLNRKSLKQVHLFQSCKLPGLNANAAIWLAESLMSVILAGNTFRQTDCPCVWQPVALHLQDPLHPRWAEHTQLVCLCIVSFWSPGCQSSAHVREELNACSGGSQHPPNACITWPVHAPAE